MFYENVATLLVKPGTDRPKRQIFNKTGSLLLTIYFCNVQTLSLRNTLSLLNVSSG